MDEKSQTINRKCDTINNPDLIREYLMRTREPPAIFQPSAMTSYNPMKAIQQNFFDMAYKHPQLLIGEKDECDKTTGAGSDDQTNRPIDNYTNPNVCTTAFKMTLFNGSNHTDQIDKTTFTSNCHLIGNVKPNLIKTWEQLNGMPSRADMIAYPNDTNGKFDSQHEYINPSIYLSTKYLLSNQRTCKNTSSQNDESFVIRRPPSQSGYFYDSIDNELVVTQDDEEQVISSLCDELEHGGEAMAEYISLIDKKEKLCWSIDSCN